MSSIYDSADESGSEYDAGDSNSFPLTLSACYLRDFVGGGYVGISEQLLKQPHVKVDVLAAMPCDILQAMFKTAIGYLRRFYDGNKERSLGTKNFGQTLQKKPMLQALEQ
ncbi:hypothetical protein HDU90_007594 [Geranomyces variabilis]|nr:hypothetical protein HDU90_007594 [Geranomyces variabilis]